MDEAVKQYQFLLDLSPQDMRLLNWHYANLEYANAANVGKLSLGVGIKMQATNSRAFMHKSSVATSRFHAAFCIHPPSLISVLAK